MELGIRLRPKTRACLKNTIPDCSKPKSAPPQEADIMNKRTPIENTEYKNEIIDHINEDHPEAVDDIARSHLPPSAAAARLIDIFQEGILMRAETQGSRQEHFIPFQLKEGDTDEQIHYLIFRAALEQGRPLEGGKNQYFTVAASEKISPNMLRLTLKSAAPLPEKAPGYAWFFSLKTLQSLSENHRRTLSESEKAAQITLMESLRDADTATRHETFDAFFSSMRYYTLRRAGKSRPDAPFADTALVDIYLHGQTNGSRWAQSLKAGDIIRSTADFHEHTAHLAEGHTVILGDETALPTVAAILENWQNPVPPAVVSITDDEADQAYLPDGLLPAGATLFRISSRGNVADNIKACLKTLAHIDAAWGAFEADDAAAIRKYLRHERGLDGKKAKVKGYWRRSGQA